MTSAAPDLACRELVELVTDYLEERLPDADRARFDLHLRECEGCRAYLLQMRAVLAAAGRIGEDSLAPEARDALLAALRGFRRG